MRAAVGARPAVGVSRSINRDPLDQHCAKALTAVRWSRDISPVRNNGAVSMRYVLALLALMVSAPAWGYDDLVLPKVDFDAISVQQVGGRETRERIRYTYGKLRIERGDGFAVTILDLTTQTEYILMANHTYLVLPMDDEYFRRFIARTVAMSGAHRLGQDRVEGIETTKYAFGDDGALEAAGTYWLSGDGIMVRRDYDAGVYGENVHHQELLTDIKLEAQPASLFGIPVGYKRAK